MINHFLAYGNADQATFRHRDVLESFDVMTVPGTIAAYYAAATAAFVLDLSLDYVIDPRTPLFQGRIVTPKKSHYSLAEWHGTGVAEHMGDPVEGHSVGFSAADYTEDVVGEMVSTLIGRQQEYGERAADLQPKIQRYARLRLLAQGHSEQEAADEARQPSPGRPPRFILAPYFATGIDDQWWDVNETIWAECERLSGVSPVLAVTDVRRLATGLSRMPSPKDVPTFLWVTGLDERRASGEALRRFLDAVSVPRQLINLYGGFFSVCLSLVGLWGFNNGLGYSEARSWPELPVTGAAPPRYYVRRLHGFLPQAVAQAFVRAEPEFACPCHVCRETAIVALSYHDLKRHFALARQWEIQLVDSSSTDDVANHLRESTSIAEFAKETLPDRVASQIRTDFLETWAEVLAEQP